MPEHINKLPSIKDVPQSAWDNLAQRKIYFGHQSVGYNIIDGIKDLIKEYPHIKLNIVETNIPGDFTKGIFAHSKVGKNRDINSKLYGFETLTKKGIGESADILMLKFCYIDMDATTNVRDILNNYDNTISNLKMIYPDVTFVHFTVPLTTIQIGPKAWIKKMIGKSIGIEENIIRNKYNQLLFEKYQGIDPVFNLSEVESTFPDGRKSIFIKDGKTYCTLVSDYTDDGGHLNEKGRKFIAEQLLIFLAKLNK